MSTFKSKHKFTNTELRLQRLESYVERLYKLNQDLGLTISVIMEKWYRDKFGENWEQEFKKKLKDNES